MPFLYTIIQTHNNKKHIEKIKTNYCQGAGVSQAIGGNNDNGDYNEKIKIMEKMATCCPQGKATLHQ